MKRLNPAKLSVDFRPGITPTNPIIPRRYTLTHSDQTGELFLTVAPEYAYDKITPIRDEVLASWQRSNGGYFLNGYVYVGGQQGRELAALRYNIFQRELPLALEAIRYGDRRFFQTHPELDEAPIFISFDSIYPAFHRVEAWGTLSDYR